MSSLISCRCLCAAPTWGQGVEIGLCLDEEGVRKTGRPVIARRLGPKRGGNARGSAGGTGGGTPGVLHQPDGWRGGGCPDKRRIGLTAAFLLLRAGQPLAPCWGCRARYVLNPSLWPWAAPSPTVVHSLHPSGQKDAALLGDTLPASLRGPAPCRSPPSSLQHHFVPVLVARAAAGGPGKLWSWRWPRCAPRFVSSCGSRMLG